MSLDKIENLIQTQTELIEFRQIWGYIGQNHKASNAELESSVEVMKFSLSLSIKIINATLIDDCESKFLQQSRETLACFWFGWISLEPHCLANR